MIADRLIGNVPMTGLRNLQTYAARRKTITLKCSTSASRGRTVVQANSYAKPDSPSLFLAEENGSDV
jgi:hypothetical protein